MFITNKVGFVGWAPTHSRLAGWVSGHHQGGAMAELDMVTARTFSLCYSAVLQMWHCLVWVTQRLLLLSVHLTPPLLFPYRGRPPLACLSSSLHIHVSTFLARWLVGRAPVLPVLRATDKGNISSDNTTAGIIQQWLLAVW